MGYFKLTAVLFFLRMLFCVAFSWSKGDCSWKTWSLLLWLSSNQPDKLQFKVPHWPCQSEGHTITSANKREAGPWSLRRNHTLLFWQQVILWPF